MMSIIRIKHSQNYTVVPNDLLNDKRLKWQDIGLLVYLLSKPSDWSVNVEALANEKGTGKDCIYSTLKRLREYGYASYTRNYDGSVDWTILDKCEPHLEKPDQENPNQENPNQDFPDVLQSKESLQSKDLYKVKNITKKKIQKKEEIESQSDDCLTVCSKHFEEFWNAYPKKVGKEAARKAFSKVKKPSSLINTIIQSIEWQKTSDQWTKDGGQYIPNPATWINQGRWQDERPDKVSNTALTNTGKHAVNVLDNWMKSMIEKEAANG